MSNSPLATVPNAADVKLRYPTSDSAVAIVRQLFMDYQEWLDVAPSLAVLRCGV